MSDGLGRWRSAPACPCSSCRAALGEYLIRWGAGDRGPTTTNGGSCHDDRNVADVVSPFDRKPFATVDTIGEDAAEALLATADRLHKTGEGRLSIPERLAVLERAGEIMTGRRDELATQAAREGGKPLMDSFVEVDRAIDGLSVCAEVLRTEQGEVIPMRINPASAGRMAVTQHVPIGPVMAVSAFNHPLNLIVHQVTPAVANGCPVMVKPASPTPLSCVAFIDILHEAGLPKAWAQTAITANNDIATKMVTNTRVRFFSFIGSPGIGWSLQLQQPAVLGLAGAWRGAPVIAHGGRGPGCRHPLDRQGRLLPRGPGLRVGPAGLCSSVHRGRLCREARCRRKRSGDRGSNGCEDGDRPADQSQGGGPGRRVGGGSHVWRWCIDHRRRAALSETTYAATLIVDPPADCRLSRQEIFGPVIAVYRLDDISEAIGRANDIDFAFQAAVFSQSIDGHGSIRGAGRQCRHGERPHGFPNGLGCRSRDWGRRALASAACPTPCRICALKKCW